MIEIITPQRVHYEQWFRLMGCYFNFYGYDANEDHFRRVFEKTQSGLIQSLLAFDGTTAVGVANYMFNQSTFYNLECYFSDLYIDVEYRGRGVAKAVMEHIFQHAHAAGCGNVNWITAPDNLLAQKLYDKIAVRPNFIMYQHDL